MDVDLHDVSELTPTVAAVAALATAPVPDLRGVAHIRGHETDRLAALAAEITALGGDVAETADGLEIRPAAAARRRRPVARLRRPPDGDRGRAARAGRAGRRVDDVDCTAKTIPDFPGRWAARVEGQAPRRTRASG